MWYIVVIVTFGLITTTTTTATSEGAYYRVLSDKITCIAEHQSIYRALGDPVFIIVSEECPPNKAVSFLDLAVNEVPSLGEFADEGLDDFLALTHDSLECLALLKVPEVEVVKFYYTECRIEAE